MIGGDEADIVYVIAPMASTAGERAPGIGGAVENVLLRQPMSRTLRDEVAAVRARGTTVVAIDLATGKQRWQQQFERVALGEVVATPRLPWSRSQPPLPARQLMN